ncbi:hypothetical protein ACFWGP_05550 [Agromyces sp. NPDC127015]|uniref:hypothetical protein n=1 Tax=Agromyces sp. NPDC127015 TaxID=3347108 RepID=UPI003655C60B
MSLIFARAAEQHRALRLQYQDVLEAAYRVAEKETRGELLNERGLRAGIDSWSLFTHNQTFAAAYASEELIDHWARRPRPTFAEFERQMLEPDWRDE